MLPEKIVYPVRRQFPMQEHLLDGNGNDHRVERQVECDQYDRYADGVLKSFQEDTAQYS